MEAGIAAIQRAAGGCGREGARPARGAARAARWSLLFLLLAASLLASVSSLRAGSLRILAYNVQLLPTGLSATGQAERVERLPEHLDGYDVLVLTEVFDATLRGRLLRDLSAEYPYSARVLGSDGLLRQDGGVVLVSRLPIVREAQHVYRSRTGMDARADKGALYACLERGEERFHVFGTHLQANSGEDPAGVRCQQLAELAGFVADRGIPDEEPLVIAGDMNIDRLAEPDGYARMVSILEARDLPVTSGDPYTYDPETNDLAEGEAREVLDYVLLGARNLAPLEVEVRVRAPRAATPWLLQDDPPRPRHDLSDHHALEARLHFPDTDAPGDGTGEMPPSGPFGLE